MWPQEKLKKAGSYSKIGPEDGNDEEAIQEDDHNTQRATGKSGTYRSYKDTALPILTVVALLSLIIIILAAGQFYGSARLYGLMQHLQQQHPITSPAVGHIYDCGNTTAEARERNCTFELFTVSWVPPACADEDLDAEFRAIGYRYFADKENTQELTYEELANRVWQTAWTTNEQHLMHCGYVWRKMHRAVEAGKRHSDRELEWEHTVHCSGLIVKPGDLGEIISIEPDFGRCY